jgi:chaperonin GroEL
MKERKDRVEDALHATQAAVEEGVLPGGGVALVRASKTVKIPPNSTDSFIAGAEIVKNAAKAPIQQIVKNVGGSPQVVLHQVLSLDDATGYDARNDKFTNMFDSGIIDPLKVVRTALENANSAACSLLSVGCALVEEHENGGEINTLI